MDGHSENSEVLRNEFGVHSEKSEATGRRCVKTVCSIGAKNEFIRTL